MDVQPLDELIRAGFLQKLKEQFRCPATFTTSPDKLASLKTMLGNKQPEYPYLFCVQQSLSPNREGYSSHRLARYGIPVTYSDDGRQALNALIIPQNFEIEVTFITNKYDGGLESVDGFSRRWQFSHRNGYTNFSVNYGLTTLDIQVLLSDTITTPVRENPADVESVYQVVTNATIKGYISEPELIPRQRVLALDVKLDVATSFHQGQFFPFPD
jgi:hypothetical protein